MSNSHPEPEIVDTMDDDDGAFTVELPISSRRAEIVDSVRENRVTIIVAETGSGKSSQVIRWVQSYILF